MAKTKKQKQEQADAYKTKLQSYQTFYIINAKGLNPNETSSMKKELNLLGSSYNLVKNSLFELALKEITSPIKELGLGEHGIIFVKEDKESETAKVVKKYIESTKKIDFTQGVFKGSIISKESIIDLSDLPSKEVLLAQLLNVMNGPTRAFVRVINGNIRKFLYLLNALKATKSS